MNESIRMVRKNLDNIPHFTLPPGYAVRWYERGDEQVWEEIQSASDKYNHITLDLYRREFGADEEQLHNRQCYVVDATGLAVGTATAWFKSDYKGLPYGRIHWVAIVPSSQGLGLAKPLMTSVCERLRFLGHNRAYLTTSTARIPAINLYLKFGFVPDISSDADLDHWRQIRGQLKDPPLSSSR